MQGNINYQGELAAAEADLRKTEETFGKDHVRVSYCLDRIVTILRNNNVRTLDANNMESRARAIRVAQNESEKKATSPKMREISEAIRASAQRAEKRKQTQGTITLIVVLIVGLAIAHAVFMPTPEERQIVRDVLTKAQDLNPAVLVKSYVDKSTESAKEAAPQKKKSTTIR